MRCIPRPDEVKSPYALLRPTAHEVAIRAQAPSQRTIQWGALLHALCSFYNYTWVQGSRLLRSVTKKNATCVGLHQAVSIVSAVTVAPSGSGRLQHWRSCVKEVLFAAVSLSVNALPLIRGGLHADSVSGE